MARAHFVVVSLLVASVGVATAPAAGASHVQATPIAGWRVDGVAKAVVVAGGRTYVGGTFSSAIAPDGTRRPRANLAAFDSRTGALIEGFRADTNGAVEALVSDGSTVWVGGSFSSIGGSSRLRLGAIRADSGAVRSFRADMSGNVYALDLAGGRLFAGGSFLWAAGQSRTRGAAFNPSTGALDPHWKPAADDTVLALKARPDASVVYLGGWFNRAGRADRRAVAAVRGSDGHATSAVFQHTFIPTLALDLDGWRLFGGVAGRSGAGDELTAWEASTGRRLWRQPADGDVQAVAHHRGTVYFGFHEGFGGNRSLRLLAANASNGAIDWNFRPSWDRFWGVYALDVTDDVVAAGGDFTRVSDISARGVAQFHRRK